MRRTATRHGAVFFAGGQRVMRKILMAVALASVAGMAQASDGLYLGAGLTQGHADAKAFSAFAVGYLPLPAPNVDIYGKAGLARWQLNGGTVQPTLLQLDSNGTEFAWGLGAQVHLSSFAVRLEYEAFNITNT